MSRTFPAIKPASRQFTGGVYPTKIYRSLAGTAFKRSFGSKPGNFRMSLVFSNIKDPVTKQILDHYYETAAGFSRFALPAQIFAGMSNELSAVAAQASTIRWEYENPPEVESVYNGISNVTVNLSGEINV
jgi:hypothetical protein